MIKVGIVGATGYTGLELLRLLINHPEVYLNCITSRSEAGTVVSALFPSLRGHIDQNFTQPDVNQLAGCDVIFFATPHCVAMEMVPELIQHGSRIIDLSADFRLRDAKLWEQWYKMPHTCPELLSKAVYGLPEVNREAIRTAQLIAVPGCYPTATQLGFLPLLEKNIIDPTNLIADTKSGISGAGRKAAIGTLLTESSENMSAYAVTGHRHLPEIAQGLNNISESEIGLTFVPHLTPMIRGIHATLYGQLKQDCDLQALFEQRYVNEPFVDILPSGSYPETRSVKGTNICRIAVHQPQQSNTVVVLSVIDNLIKGASGQAIQNMNIMFGFPETMALNIISVQP